MSSNVSMPGFWHVLVKDSQLLGTCHTPFLQKLRELQPPRKCLQPEPRKF